MNSIEHPSTSSSDWWSFHGIITLVEVAAGTLVLCIIVGGWLVALAALLILITAR